MNFYKVIFEDGEYTFVDALDRQEAKAFAYVKRKSRKIEVIKVKELIHDVHKYDWKVED